MLNISSFYEKETANVETKLFKTISQLIYKHWSVNTSFFFKYCVFQIKQNHFERFNKFSPLKISSN